MSKKQTEASAESWNWTWVLIIGGIALFVRLLYQMELRTIPEFAVLILDPHIHDTVARAIADGNFIGSEVFFRAPLYLYLVGFLYFLLGPSPWSVRILQAVLGAATAVLVYRIGRRSFSEGVGRISGLVAALTWSLVYFDGELLITSLVTFLDLLLLDRLIEAARRPDVRRWGVAGIVLGVSAIARPTILVFGWLAVLWIGWVVGTRRFRAITFYVLGSLLVIAPVTVRNAVVGKDFVLVASQGGINFFLGNNSHATGWSATSPEIGRDWWGGFDDAVRIAEEEAGRDLKPSEVSRYWTRRGLEFWRDDPSAALRLGIRKLFFFWGAVELGNNRDIEFHRRQAWILRVLPFSMGWIAPFALLGLAIMGRRRERVLLLLFVLLYMATVVLFFVCARFRMPVVPVLAVVATAGAGWLVRAVRDRNARRALPGVVAVAILALFLHADLYGVRDPLHTQSFFNRGLVYRRLGDDRAEEAAYLETLSRDPNYLDALNNLGGLYARQGRWDEARRLFERAQTLDAGNARAIYNMGVVSENQGDSVQAERRYREALDSDPHLLPAKAALARIEERGGNLHGARILYQEVYEAYESSAGVGPGDIRIRFEEEAETGRLDVLIALGRIAQKQGVLGSALNFYRKALDLSPDDRHAHYRVGYTLLRMRQYEEALAMMQSELDRYPDDLSARYALALCYGGMGSTLPAIREFKVIVAADPTHDRAWQNLGVLYAKTEAYDEAIEAFKRALEINPQNRFARQNLEKAEEYRFRE